MDVYNVNDYKFINFPWKINAFIKYFLDYDMSLHDKIPVDLIKLLESFTYGDEEYLSKQRTKMQENLTSRKRRFIYEL